MKDLKGMLEDLVVLEDPILLLFTLSFVNEVVSDQELADLFMMTLESFLVGSQLLDERFHKDHDDVDMVPHHLEENFLEQLPRVEEVS